MNSIFYPILYVGMYGQLGHGSTEKQPAPKLVTSLETYTVYILACGNFHTVSISVALSIATRYLIQVTILLGFL